MYEIFDQPNDNAEIFNSYQELRNYKTELVGGVNTHMYILLHMAYIIRQQSRNSGKRSFEMIVTNGKMYQRITT